MSVSNLCTTLVGTHECKNFTVNNLTVLDKFTTGCYERVVITPTRNSGLIELSDMVVEFYRNGNACLIDVGVGRAYGTATNSSWVLNLPTGWFESLGMAPTGNKQGITFVRVDGDAFVRGRISIDFTLDAIAIYGGESSNAELIFNTSCTVMPFQLSYIANAAVG